MAKWYSDDAPGLTLVTLWCWLNVAAMAPTLGDPVVVLFGFAARGPDALLLKILIFANAIVASTALSLRLHAGRFVMMAWFPLVLASNIFTHIVPSCPYPVKVAAYQQTLFGGLVPYLYVTLVPSANFLAMHVVDALVTVAVFWMLIKHRSRFRHRAPVVRRTQRAG